MKLLREFSIKQTMITLITVIIATSVILSVVLIYTINRETTRDLVYGQASEINKQIVLNYENYTNRVSKMMNLFQKRFVEDDMVWGRATLMDLFTAMDNIEPSVGAITLFSNSGELVLSTREVQTASKEIAVEDWFVKPLYDNSVVHYSSPHTQTIYAQELSDVISVTSAVEYIDGGVNKSGILLIDMNFQGLDELSNITNLGEEGHFIIIDAEDNIIYSSEDKYDVKSDSYSFATHQIFGGKPVTIDGDNMLMNINTIGATRWRIATFQNINSVELGLQRALYTIIVLVTITLIITVIVAYVVSSKITNPLSRLDDAIIKFQEGNIDSKVEVEGQKEIRIVSEGFNDMIDEIHRLMDRVVVEQEGKRKSEISVLQNQINPHFLYNTLDCIIWLAETNRNEDLVNTVNALSTYFRVSLSKGKQFISIAEELLHIKSYMTIQSLRYNQAFTYEVDCDESVADYRIMKLILQPLVENAIYHGIDKEDEDSYINIHVKDEGDIVCLSVMNSGYGITEEKIMDLYRVMEEGNEKGSVGMKNVYHRVKLFYGDEAKIHIDSELDESTTISILIPKTALEQERKG